MKILFITQYFYPEIFRGNDIAFYLARENNVTVVTAVPNYPKGFFFEGYGTFCKSRETINGIRIVRVPTIPRGKAGKVRLSLNYLTYLLFASLYTIKLALTEKFDFVFVQQLSPVTMAIPGVLYKKIRNVPLYIWVLDLWPESLQSAGDINNRLVLKIFTSIAKIIYKNSSKILISSRGFRNSIIDKDVNPEKLIFFPNWAEEIFENPPTEIVETPTLLSGFRVMFAGNIGEAQDFPSLMQAALLLKGEKDIKFIIIGEGRKKRWLETFIIENKLEETVQLLGGFPISHMPSLFDKADIMLVSLKDELIFNLTTPAKIQAYMASSKPIVAMMNGEGAALIKEAECGFAVGAGEFEKLSNQIKDLHQFPSGKLKEYGERGRNYYNKYFNKQSCLEKLSKILELE